MIKPQQGSEPAAARLLAAIQSGPEAVPSEALVLQSRDLAMRAIEQLGLDQDPEFRATSAAPGKSEAAHQVSLAVVNAFMAVNWRSSWCCIPGVIRVAFRSAPARRSRPRSLNTIVRLYLDGLVAENQRRWRRSLTGSG